MNADPPEVFLFAAERKDVQCLSPLRECLIDSGVVVHLTALAHCSEICDIYYRPVFTQFINSRDPIAVCSSSWMIDLLKLIRAPDTFRSINIEHGIAPFKNYTFGPHLLVADYYFAPTPLWAERLQRLYPDQADKVRIGGFPRLEVLREMRTTALLSGATSELPDPRLAKWMAASGPRKLVILTWGTNPEELDKLPDRENIAYLYHPADGPGLAARKSRHCSLFLSTAELATSLLCAADRLYGDFSSLTLEALALGIPTNIFIERNFYVSNCDLGEEFFDRGSSDFGRIPETEYRLDAKRVVDGSQLATALDGTAADFPSFTAADLPPGLLPPTDCDNRKLTAQLILEIAQCTPTRSGEELPADRFENAMFVLDAYLQVLGRPADLTGMKHYLSKIENSESPRPVIALEVIYALAKSEEGQKRFSFGNWGFPKIEVNTPIASRDTPLS